MRYMNILKSSFCDGLGVRVVVFVSGCTHGCVGCHNKCAWNFNSGIEFGYKELSNVVAEVEKPYVKGITLSGGDPLHSRNIDGCFEIAKTVKEYVPNKDVWCYTGYTWEEVKDLPIMQYIDVLVDGKFELDKRDVTLAFRGSSNQRVINVKESLRTGEIVLLENT